MNKPDINYSSIYFIFDNNIKFLKEINIDFNKIIKITLDKGPEFKTDNNIIFETLFSFDSIKNNLISLKIIFRFNEDEFTSFLERKPSKKVRFNAFNKINDLKALRDLSLYYVDFAENVTIRLNSLKRLICGYCKKLNFTDIICPNLKELTFYNKEINTIDDFKKFSFDNFKKLKALYVWVKYKRTNVLDSIKNKN